jgi:hypothetical protein
VSSHLRFITAASLIIFGGVIGVGAVALLPGTADRTQLANAATSDLPATSCKSWLPFDRNCLTKRDLPWTSGRGTVNSVTGEVPAEAENAVKPPVTEGQRVAVAPQAEPPKLPVFQPPVSSAQPSTFQAVPQTSPSETSAPRAPQTSAAPVPAPQPVEPRASAPQASTPPVAPRPALAALPQDSTPQTQSPQPSPPSRVQRNNIATPAAKAPSQRLAAKERVAARVAAEDDEEETRAAKKKSFRPERTARRSTNDALNAVRKFGDSPREIPATSYAADGSPRNIVIRPTSIQDVYYYSSHR